MATQNFVAGGFYGKLGDMVGQRWRNKRTLRQYVIGANPQTPAQQANRGVFGASVALAQQAMNINKGAPAWADVAVGEFSLRVGTAKTRLQLSQPEGEAVPIFPDAYIPHHSFTAATLRNPIYQDLHRLTLTPDPPEGSRSMCLAVYVRDLITGAWGIQYLTAALPAAPPTYFGPVLSTRYGFASGAWVEGATIADVEHSDNAFFLPRLAATEPLPITREYEGEFIDIEWFADRFEALYETPNTPFQDPGTMHVALDCMYFGEFQTVDDLGTVVWLGGNQWRITGPRSANISYPEGSYINTLEDLQSLAYYDRNIILLGQEIEQP